MVGHFALLQRPLQGSQGRGLSRYLYQFPLHTCLETSKRSQITTFQAVQIDFILTQPVVSASLGEDAATKGASTSLEFKLGLEEFLYRSASLFWLIRPLSALPALPKRPETISINSTSTNFRAVKFNVVNLHLSPDLSYLA